MRIVIALLLLFFTQNSFAQDFKYKGELTPVDSSAYYRIKLLPSVYNHLNKYKSDLRIYDSKMDEVPYLLEEVADCDKNQLYKLKGVTISQKDLKKAKKSVVNIELPHAARISGIQFKVSGPVHYKRFGNLSYTNMDNSNLKRKRNQKESISVHLSSDDSLPLSISEAKVKELILEIENEDNPPLTFSSAEIWQENRFLVAYLEKGEQYRIYFGSNEASYPRYDLTYFKSKIPDSPRVVEVKNIMKQEPKPITEVVLYKNKNFIWATIFVSVVILVFISIRMAREMSK